MSHSGEKQYQYTLFGMSFSDSSYFIRHMRAHIEEKTKSVPTVTNHFQKKLCFIMRSLERISYPEGAPYTLRHHMSILLGINNFIIANVISLFLKKEILTHMAIHTGKKPDPCTKCGKAFSQKVILKYHMTIHCDKFFS